MLSQNEPATTRLVWSPEASLFQVGRRSGGTQEPFIKGPLPLVWIERAAALPGKTIQVALAIWFQVGLEGTQTVKLGQKRVDRFCVSRDARYDALRRLAEAGLIQLVQQPGQSPVVTVILPSKPH